MKIFLVAGARPNFMKIAPIVRALQKLNGRPGESIDWKIIHTGQHYDYEMSDAFFEDLGIPKPDYHLDVGSGTHAEQTAKIMVEFEKVCDKERPDVVVVVGDVNSTLACSIVAKKMGVKVAHVEAGLRSRDMTMPEEINRMVTDSISDFFFATEKSAVDNLFNEGKTKEQIFFVGHVMVDNLLHQVKALDTIDAEALPVQHLKNTLPRYIFLTLHRPSNVDDKEIFRGIVEALNEIAVEIPVVFPVHPRTRKMMAKHGIGFNNSVYLFPPLGFKESLFLWKDAVLVMTDSGGLQEETTALGIPCLTIRENTERPITVELGTNTLAGNKKEGILNAYEQIMKNGKKKASIPPKWDGHAAERIVEILVKSNGE